MKRVAIIPGFSEGRWHAHRLSTELARNGFDIVSPNRAQIIITHSGGIYLLQASFPVQLLVVNGLPNMSRTKTLSKLHTKIINDYRHHKEQDKLKAWRTKTSYNMIYFVRHPILWSKMLAKLNPDNLSKLKARRVLVVNNSDDVFNDQRAVKELSRKYGWEYKAVPGQHDDLWHNPKKYIDIIKGCV